MGHMDRLEKLLAGLEHAEDFHAATEALRGVAARDSSLEADPSDPTRFIFDHRYEVLVADIEGLRPWRNVLERLNILGIECAPRLIADVEAHEGDIEKNFMVVVVEYPGSQVQRLEPLLTFKSKIEEKAWDMLILDTHRLGSHGLVDEFLERGDVRNCYVSPSGDRITVAEWKLRRLREGESAERATDYLIKLVKRHKQADAGAKNGMH